MASPPSLQEEHVGSWASYATIQTNICLLRRKPQGRKVGSHDRISGKPTRLDGFAVIRLRQRPARNLPLVVYDCSERWAKMCEHEVLCAHALCQGAEIGCQALAIEGSRRKPAALVRPHDGVERRVHDDVRPVRQFLHLRGCRGSAWWGEHIVACVAADLHTSSRRVYAIGRMARSMRRPDRTHVHAPGGPTHLRVVLRLSCVH